MEIKATIRLNIDDGDYTFADTVGYVARAGFFDALRKETERFKYELEKQGKSN